MGVVNQYHVGNDNKETLVQFESYYSGWEAEYDPDYPYPGDTTGKNYEIYYEGKHYELLDVLHEFAARENVEFYVFCNGEMREDYYYAIINKDGIYRKDIEIIYPSFRDCEDMM